MKASSLGRHEFWGVLVRGSSVKEEIWHSLLLMFHVASIEIMLATLL